MRNTGLSKISFTIMLVFILALAACGGDGGNGSDDDASDSDSNSDSDAKSEDDLYSPEDFEPTKTNEGEAIEGGSLSFGLVSDTAFDGTFNYNFYSGDPDVQVLDWFDEGLIGMDENYTYTQDGAATFEEEEGRIFTFTINDDVNWHDGEPLTAEDWQFAYEVIGHPDYDGIRYGSDFTGIEGMDEYHAGETDDISGVKVIDDKVLEITYKESHPSLLTGGIWPYALAKHIFGDMDVADISSSKELRENPVGIGPFKVDSVTPGESVVYSKNEDYWRGEPNLDEVVLKVINPDVVVQALESGEVDMINDFPAGQFPDNAEMSNVEYLADIDLYYSYVGFKLGDWDAEEKEVATDLEGSKMGDVKLRTAMAKAIDMNAVGEQLYNGLRWKATTFIPPSHPEFHDEDNPGHEYDVDKANEILDEAGYELADGEDYRTDPDGEELVMNFASMSGDEIAEPLADYYIQSWEEVGLNVQLLEGKLHEFNSFYERVGETGEDDPEIDIYSGAWGVGSDVDPRGLYGRDAMFNFSRYSSEENDELLEDGVSEEAFDLEYRQEVYNDWQQLMIDEVPVIPALYALEIVPVNNRVVNWTLDDAEDMYRYEVGVTQDEAMVAE